MISSGTIGMPLHFGKVPSFLTTRMGQMGDAIVESIVYNYGKSEVLTRMSDPNWFQALGAVMGMACRAPNSRGQPDSLVALITTRCRTVLTSTSSISFCPMRESGPLSHRA